MKTAPKWALQAKIGHLAELHAERRFYSTFHNTLLFSIIALYSGLIAMQAILLSQIYGKQPIILSTVALFMVKWAIPSIILLIIPVLFTYMFIIRHFDQGIIRDKINALERDLGFPDRYIEDEKYTDFVNKSNWQKFRIGRGHSTYIMALWLFVGVNIFLTYLLLHYMK